MLADCHHACLPFAARNVHLAIRPNQDIDFAADAEILLVNAGFDREARARQDAAVFAGLQAVHVGAVAVDFLADAVSGAMDEILAKAGLLDDGAGGLIDFPAGERALAGKGILDERDRGVASGSLFVVSRPACAAAAVVATNAMAAIVRDFRQWGKRIASPRWGRIV